MVLRRRGSAAVGATVDLPESGAQVHDARVSGPEHEGSWRSANLRVVQPFPTVAPVGAAVGAVLGPGANHFRVVRVNHDAGHQRVCRQPVGQFLPLVGARRQGVDAAFFGASVDVDIVLAVVIANSSPIKCGYARN